LKPKLPPEFHPENRLEELLLLLGKTAEATADFYREFLNADIITLGSPDPGSKVKVGIQRLEEGMNAHVSLVEYSGEPVVPIFSSMARMTTVIPESYYGETGYLGMNCKTLLAVMSLSNPRSKFVLNPGHMVVKVFSPEEVRAVLNGTIFKMIEDDFKTSRPIQVPLQKGTGVSLGRPKEIPTALMDKLAKHFKATGYVEEAFIGQIHVPSSGQPPHLLICLKLRENSGKTFDQVSVDLGPTIRSALSKEEFLDIVDVKSQPAWPSQLIRFFPK